MKVSIDGCEIVLDEPLTIYQAATRLGIEIPTMCHMEGYDPFTSCMLCVGQRQDLRGGPTPRVPRKVADGMEIETQCEEIREASANRPSNFSAERTRRRLRRLPCQRRLRDAHSEVPAHDPRNQRSRRPSEKRHYATVRRKIWRSPQFSSASATHPAKRGVAAAQHDEGLSPSGILPDTSRIGTCNASEPYLFAHASEASGQDRRDCRAPGPAVSPPPTYLAQKGHACTVL